MTWRFPTLRSCKSFCDLMLADPRFSAFPVIDGLRADAQHLP